ncbi:hypothetical protein [Streptomyces platensis]|uniref:hypothetical protein n=1 Tax=Streptomyces platensis TaxID=58346 RepID=UPI002E812497|nr:hypothetical protein [Streptomyces platensis]WUB82332.1 hypothetical protein OG424_25980 [Streptomyces platensis]
MPVPRLVAAVYVQDPCTREELILLPGDEPSPELAALVTNPDAWEVPPEPGEQEDVAPDAEHPPADDAAVAAAPNPSRKSGGQRRARPSAE